MSAQEAPSHPIGSRVLYEDDRLRVWELEVEPGDTFPQHHHMLDYVTVALDEGHLEVLDADGSIVRNHRKVGDIQVTRVGQGQIHALRNVGTTRYRNRIIEFKSEFKSSAL